MRVRLRGWNETASIPDLTIAEAAVVVPEDLGPTDAVWLDAAFPAGTLAPAGGRFVITVEALADRKALIVLQTDGRNAPRTTWVQSDIVRGGEWTAISDVSAELGGPMQIRATLGVPQPHAIDDSFTTLVGHALSDNVATNDIPSPMGGNTWSTAMLPNYGNLTMNADGSFIYVPLAGFDGPDYFTYRVCDSQSRCDVGDVAIMVRELDVFRDGFESP